MNIHDHSLQYPHENPLTIREYVVSELQDTRDDQIEEIKARLDKQEALLGRIVEHIITNDISSAKLTSLVEGFINRDIEIIERS